METWPEAMSGSIMGTRKGLTREGPFLSMTPTWSDRVMMPPIPLAIMTETLSRLPLVIAAPEASRASREAAAASWTKRSMRLACLRST